MTPMTRVEIRQSTAADLAAISDLALAAFGIPEGAEIVGLIDALLRDATARPVLSLVATIDGVVVGHVLFTRVRLEPAGTDVAAALLAPLAVHPDHQSRGIGGQLVAAGLRHLADTGVGLVFVLGHPGYYPRFGFSAAGVRGLSAPYPIPEKNADAWMVLELRAGAIPNACSRVVCADALADPKYWRE